MLSNKLSVDNYFRRMTRIKRNINSRILLWLNSQKYLFFRNKIFSEVVHLVQSEYAKSFLASKNINSTYLLEDYLHENFISRQFDIVTKKNIVAYNPKKGAYFINKLIKAMPEIKFQPIINMSQDEVIELLTSAKIYIDFGNHPGKDRIPREAAHLKCCVISNKMGSAKNNKDLPIPQKYKFDQSNASIVKIQEKIIQIFDDYPNCLSDFNSYRLKIKHSEEIMNSQIKNIFIN